MGGARFFLVLLVCVAGLAGSLYLSRHWRAAAAVNQLIVKDWAALGERGKLPRGIADVRTVTMTPIGPAARELSNRLDFPIQPKADGPFDLEVEVIQFEDASGEAAIVMVRLVRTENKNTEWELGRTYELPKKFIFF